MKGLRTLFGRIFGARQHEKEIAPSSPTPHFPAERKVRDWLEGRARLDGRYTRKSRDRRPPALRYQQRFEKGDM